MLLVSLIIPYAAVAATLDLADVRVRSIDSPTPPGNTAGIYYAFIPSSTISMNDETKFEVSVDNMQAKAFIGGGKMKLLASGFWDNSPSDTSDPSYAAEAHIRLRDSFTLTSSGPVALSFKIAVDGSITASNGNAFWAMSAYLAQGYIGSYPVHPSHYDYDRGVGLTMYSHDLDPPWGYIDRLGDTYGLTMGGVFNSFLPEGGPPLFEPNVPIEVFWNFRVFVDDANSYVAPIGSPGSASANFYNTATWLGITARNLDGEIVTVTANGDYDWLASAAAPIPLPAPVWLMLSGLAALTWRFRRHDRLRLTGL